MRFRSLAASWSQRSRTPSGWLRLGPALFAARLPSGRLGVDDSTLCFSPEPAPEAVSFWNRRYRMLEQLSCREVSPLGIASLPRWADFSSLRASKGPRWSRLGDVWLVTVALEPGSFLTVFVHLSQPIPCVNLLWLFFRG